MLEQDLSCEASVELNTEYLTIYWGTNGMVLLDMNEAKALLKFLQANLPTAT